MTMLDDIPEINDPIHLLLIGDSKTGKSTYVAQAAADGFCVAYFDSDNGISAVRHHLKSNQPARNRIHYWPVSHSSTFLTNLLRSNDKSPFRWIPRTGKLWGPLAVGVEPEDDVWEFNITKLPPSWILTIDGWTSAAADALGIGSADQAAVLLEGTDQGIYGTASSALTYICNMIQKLPSHVVVQAHGTKYEVYDRPPNTIMRLVKQGDMILRETIDVPVSSSRPHGHVMGGRFNHIGWLSITLAGNTEIDFTRSPRRIGGGPPNIKADITNLPFSKLSRTIPPAVDAPGFFTKTTHKELSGNKPSTFAALKPDLLKLQNALAAKS